MSCFRFSTVYRHSRRPDVSREHTSTSEDEEYKEYRKTAQIEHANVFRVILHALVDRVRKRERQCELDEIKKGDLIRLDRVRYFEVLKSSFPDVVFDKKDLKKGKLCLRGRDRSFENAYDKCFKQLHDMNVVQKTLSLSMDEKWKWDIIANVHCQKYFDESMSAKDIMAEITAAADCHDAITITALNEIEYQKASKLLEESLMEDVFPIPDDCTTSFDGSDFRNFINDQERNRPLKISYRESDDKETANIHLVGVRYVVKEAKEATKNFIEIQREKECEVIWDVSDNKSQFLQRYLSDLVKPLEDDCEVRIEIEHRPRKCIIRLKGIPESVDKCKSFLEELNKGILEIHRCVELPGVQKLISGKDGQKQLKLIQEAKKVYIVGSDDHSQKHTNILHRGTQKKEYQAGPSTIKVGVGPKENSQHVIISFKHGNIENERAGILAYSALKNLNHYTADGAALAMVGGRALVEDCKRHTGVYPGEIVCTTGGNLACEHVFHAVGCEWKNDKKSNETIFRKVVSKCLQKCIDLHAVSLAMTCFGADKEGYTSQEVLEIVREELKVLDATMSDQISLESIHVVSNKLMKKLRHSATSLSSHPKSKTRERGHSSPMQVTPTSKRQDMFCCESFESVDVVLNIGEKTTQVADAMINILPSHPQRPSEDSVCHDILQACGESLQDVLNRHIRSNHTRSIFTTPACGSIKNVKDILHVTPASCDRQGLQASLEQCLDFAKTISARMILFPVAEDMSLDISLKSLVELLLEAAHNFSINNSEALEIVVLVSKKNEFDDLKLLFELPVIDGGTSAGLVDDDSDVFVGQKTENSSVFSHNDDQNCIGKSDMEAKINIPLSKRREDKLLLQYVGLESGVNDSISEVMDFVDRHKAKKSIHIGEGFKFRQKHIHDLKQFAFIYHVEIDFVTPYEITIEGVKDNVFECHEKIADLLNKYDKDEINQVAETRATCEDSEGSESSNSWPWEEKSEAHQERFRKFIQYGQEYPEEIKQINGVRFCCSSEDFCIGRGSDGTRVYIGLGKDGYEKAVKRLHKDQCRLFAVHEKHILNEPSIADSQCTVKYWYFDDKSDKEYAYLILDLCEETLGEYVERNCQNDLQEAAPKIIRQILEGLKDLHEEPNAILHRDLRPSNILRNTQNKWLLADFGISRILPQKKDEHVSVPRGNAHWRAVEAHASDESPGNAVNVRYQRESDIQTAGMVAYFIVSKGEHPFGTENCRISNLKCGNPVGLSCINNPALKDLLEWMLSHSPDKRPSAKEALKHPYLQSAAEQFELLSTLGNLDEIKDGDPSCNVVQQINTDTKDWTSLVDKDVYSYLCVDAKKSRRNRYSRKWTDCLRFIRNAKHHWKDKKPNPRPTSIQCEPQDYFLKIFPYLPVTVHRIVRSCNWKEREELKRFFT